MNLGHAWQIARAAEVRSVGASALIWRVRAHAEHVSARDKAGETQGRPARSHAMRR